MFRTDLDGGRSGEAKRNDRFVNRTMPELALSPIGLEGTKLPIGPPVLVVGERGEESRRIGREGASGVFRGNN